MIYTRAGSVNVAVFRREWRGERREEKPMNQTIFRFTLCAVLFAVSFPAEAQQQGKVPRIGILLPNPPTLNPHLLKAFQQGLRELGYVEGQNIVIEYRLGRESLNVTIILRP